MQSFEFMQPWDGRQEETSEAEQFQVCRDFFLAADLLRQKYAAYEEQEGSAEEPERHIDFYLPSIHEDDPEVIAALYFTGRQEMPSFSIITPLNLLESNPDQRYGRQHTYYYEDGAIRRSDSLCAISQLCWMADNGLLGSELQGIDDPLSVLQQYPEVLSYHWQAMNATTNARVNRQPISSAELLAVLAFVGQCNPINPRR